MFAGLGSPDDLVSPTFRTYATKKNKDELELIQAHMKVRELRGGPAVVADEREETQPAPKKGPKGGRKGGGWGDAA